MWASHGHFARGLQEQFVAADQGRKHGVIPVCAYDEDIVTTEQLEQTPEHLIVQANGDEVVDLHRPAWRQRINNSAERLDATSQRFRGRRH